VSIAVTDDVPLKDVLLELAKLADIDIDLDAISREASNLIARTGRLTKSSIASATWRGCDTR